MNVQPEAGRAVRYACAVLADCRPASLPMDPGSLAARAGILLVPLSRVENYPLWVPYDIFDSLRSACAVTVSYPAFCIVFRDDAEPDRLRLALFHELGHIFMNHYRDFPERMDPSRPDDPSLEAEADAFALNMTAPVPVVDVIRYNRPAQARGNVFGLPRSLWISRLDALAEDRACVDEDMANTLIWLFHDWLLPEEAAHHGRVFSKVVIPAGSSIGYHQHIALRMPETLIWC